MTGHSWRGEWKQKSEKKNCPGQTKRKRRRDVKMKVEKSFNLFLTIPS
jgi:hypothetical protein